MTAAFIFSLVGLLCCAVFAILGLLKADECLSEIEAGRISQDKKSLATAAKIISIISLVLWGISFTVTFLGRLNG